MIRVALLLFALYGVEKMLLVFLLVEDLWIYYCFLAVVLPQIRETSIEAKANNCDFLWTGKFMDRKHLMNAFVARKIGLGRAW